MEFAGGEVDRFPEDNRVFDFIAGQTQDAALDIEIENSRVVATATCPRSRPANVDSCEPLAALRLGNRHVQGGLARADVFIPEGGAAGKVDGVP